MTPPTAPRRPPLPAVEAALVRLGENVRATRLARNLTMEALARQVGVGRGVIADIESGRTSTGIAAWAAVFWALGFLDDFSRIAATGPAAETTARPGESRQRARGKPRFDEPF